VNVVREIFPLALAAFFIYKGTHSRIYLLGIPFLMFMRSSVFFENARPFWIPGRFSPDTHVVLWLIVVWLVCTNIIIPAKPGAARIRPFGHRLSLPEEALIVVVAAYGVLQVAVTIVQNGDASRAFGEAQGFVYLFLGYFLVRAIVSTVSLVDVLAFVRTLVIVNTGAAVLFILHQAAGVTIYAGAEYYTTTFMGETITRTFYFMPQLLPLSIAYIFSRRRWNAWTVIGALVNLAAVWISYTRSLAVIAVVIIVISLVTPALKKGQAGLVLSRALASVVVLAALLFGVTQLFPVQSEYFAGRLNEAVAAPSVTSVSNIENRENKIQVTYRSISRTDAMLGAGWVTAAQDPMAARVERMQSDIVWVPILYRLGLLGVALWVAVFAVFIWRAGKLAAKTSPEIELFGVVWLGVIVGLFLEGFLSWTFMQPGRHAMALWAFAFLGAVASMLRFAPENALTPRPEDP
jgi:hypothetical protein